MLRCAHEWAVSSRDINNRPRLGYLTPTESLALLLAGEPYVASTT